MRNLTIALKVVIVIAALVSLSGTAVAEWTAFNDTTFESGSTHANTTLYRGDGNEDGSSGKLKNIVTGDELPVTVTIAAYVTRYGNNGAQPTNGTDAYNIFDGYVDFRDTGPFSGSLEMERTDMYYTYTFTGLNPAMTYDFAGTAIRGGYNDRWTKVTLDGADGYTNAHSTGAGTVQPGVAGLGMNQMAMHTGMNSHADQGYVAYWTDIDPGTDGTISVNSQWYQPGGGSKGYGLHGIMLVEVPEPSTLLLAAMALLGLAAFGWRRRRA